MMNHSRPKLDPMVFTWASGHRELPLVRIRRIMERYISPIMVASVFDKALKIQGENGSPTVDEIVEHCMVGLRLFVPPDRLSQLMVDLAEVLIDQ